MDKYLEMIKKYFFKHIALFICAFVAMGSIGFSVYYVYTNKCPVCEECDTGILNKINDEEKTEDTQRQLKVDVKGAVKNPKVYELVEGSVIEDAINLAGGIKSGATLENINLSKKLSDEMVIYVFTKDELEEKKAKNEVVCEIPKCECETIIVNECIDNEVNGSKDNISSKPDSNFKISINTASVEELTALDGIGESKAKSIIEYREKNGKFSKIEDIMSVSGIGESAFQKIKDYITI